MCDDATGNHSLPQIAIGLIPTACVAMSLPSPARPAARGGGDREELLGSQVRLPPFFLRHTLFWRLRCASVFVFASSDA